MKNLKSTAIAKVNSRAYHKNLIRLALMFCMATMIFCNNVICAYANAENAKPTGAGGATTMSTMVNIVFWIVRVIIVAFAIPGIIKIVQGQSDENPTASLKKSSRCMGRLYATSECSVSI